MAETEELTRKWTLFVRRAAIERIIAGTRRAMVTKVEEIRERDLLHLCANDDSDELEVWVRVTDRDGDVLSIEVDDIRHCCTCPTLAETYGRHVEGCPVG